MSKACRVCVCACRRLVECMVSKATAVKNQQAMH